MPRRKMLTDRQRAALLNLPTDEAAMLRHYTLVQRPNGQSCDACSISSVTVTWW